VVVVVVSAVVVGGVVVVVAVAVVSCWRHSVAASCAIVTAPWFKLSRRVRLTVMGRLCTSRRRAALALTAAPQSPDCTAELIWSPCPLSAIDWSEESRPAPPPQAATHDTAKPSPPARMARGP
jgi:hypothetical protein